MGAEWLSHRDMVPEVGGSIPARRGRISDFFGLRGDGGYLVHDPDVNVTLTVGLGNRLGPRGLSRGGSVTRLYTFVNPQGAHA